MYQHQPNQLNLTDVVKNLLIINVGFFLATMFMPQLKYELSVYFPTSAQFRPYQIVTHMFMHADFRHILFNMFGLATFGPMIEMVWRPQRFLTYYLACGLGALAFQFASNYWQIQSGEPAEIIEMIPMLGASGCIFGLLTAFAMLYPNQEIGIIFLPFAMKAKYAVPAFAALELFLGLGNFQSGVAHFAHLGGAVTGFLLITFWWKGFR